MAHAFVKDDDGHAKRLYLWKDEVSGTDEYLESGTYPTRSDYTMQSESELILQPNKEAYITYSPQQEQEVQYDWPDENPAQRPAGRRI